LLPHTQRWADRHSALGKGWGARWIDSQKEREREREREREGKGKRERKRERERGANFNFQTVVYA
jgi:hypothetical protein